MITPSLYRADKTIKIDMQERQKPKDVFEVVWLGKNPTYKYSKVFHTVGEATSFASEVKDSLVYHLENTSKKSNSAKFRLIKTDEAHEFMKSIRLHRKLRGKTGFTNVDGASSVGVTTTTEYTKSQKARLLTVLAVAPLIVYAGWKLKDTDSNILGYATMLVGGVIGLNNAKTYMVNRKIS